MRIFCIITSILALISIEQRAGAAPILTSSTQNLYETATEDFGVYEWNPNENWYRDGGGHLSRPLNGFSVSGGMIWRGTPCPGGMVGVSSAGWLLQDQCLIQTRPGDTIEFGDFSPEVVAFSIYVGTENAPIEVSAFGATGRSDFLIQNTSFFNSMYLTFLDVGGLYSVMFTNRSGYATVYDNAATLAYENPILPGCGPSGGVPPKCNPPVVPLPATFPLLAAGLFCFGLMRRFARQSERARDV